MEDLAEARAEKRPARVVAGVAPVVAGVAPGVAPAWERKIPGRERETIYGSVQQGVRKSNSNFITQSTKYGERAKPESIYNLGPNRFWKENEAEKCDICFEGQSN